VVSARGTTVTSRFNVTLTREGVLELLRSSRLKVDPLYPDTVREGGLGLRIGGEYAIYAYEGAAVNTAPLSRVVSRAAPRARTACPITVQFSESERDPRLCLPTLHLR